MGKKFYDIHFHAMDLGHPNILAFIKKIKLPLVLLVPVLALPVALAKVTKIKMVNKLLNLLTVMENDAGSFFMLVEFYLRETGTVRNGLFTVGDETFDGMVITPLLMDFGYKNILTDTFYKIPPQKPIVAQVEDVFNGIATYKTHEFQRVPGTEDQYRIVPRTLKPVFEIYPFLGLNTKNYTLKEIMTMLNKYFGNGYRGRYADFQANGDTFQGNINTMGVNLFAGIKLYPPIGFDPWPEGDSVEMAKVQSLYDFCSAKQIPVTVHCSDGGFKLEKNAADLTCPEKWQRVLAQFGKLKLNFAHFGKQSERDFYIFKRTEWRDRVVALIRDYPNVYADFSYFGLDDDHYHTLADACSKNPFIGEKLLFGSDFMINLIDMESYNRYLELFARTQAFDTKQKAAFANTNPERFLWQA